MCPPTHTHTNPFNLIFDKIIKFIDDVTNLNNFGKLSLDKHLRWGYSWISLKIFIFVFSFVLLAVRFYSRSAAVCRTFHCTSMTNCTQHRINRF